MKPIGPWGYTEEHNRIDLVAEVRLGPSDRILFCDPRNVDEALGALLSDSIESARDKVSDAIVANGAGTWKVYEITTPSGSDPMLVLERELGRARLRKGGSYGWLALWHDEVAVALGPDHRTVRGTKGPGIYYVYARRTRSGHLAYFEVALSQVSA